MSVLHAACGGEWRLKKPALQMERIAQSVSSLPAFMVSYLP